VRVLRRKSFSIEFSVRRLLFFTSMKPRLHWRGGGTRGGGLDQKKKRCGASFQSLVGKKENDEFENGSPKEGARTQKRETRYITLLSLQEKRKKSFKSGPFIAAKMHTLTIRGLRLIVLVPRNAPNEKKQR